MLSIEPVQRLVPGRSLTILWPALKDQVVEIPKDLDTFMFLSTLCKVESVSVKKAMAVKGYVLYQGSGVYS